MKRDGADNMMGRRHRKNTAKDKYNCTPVQLVRKKMGSVQLSNAVHLFWTNEGHSVSTSISIFIGPESDHWLCSSVTH